MLRAASTATKRLSLCYGAHVLRRSREFGKTSSCLSEHLLILLNMKSGCKRIFLAAVMVLMAGTLAIPVKRPEKDLEARRRSAIDRSLIRFGRSYPASPSAAEIRETFDRPSRKGNNFLRFGRTQPLTLTTDELLSLLKSYDQDYDDPVSKREASFIRLGREPQFIRLGRGPSFIRYGRSSESEVADEKEVGPELVVSGNPERKSRARDYFIRLGRDSEELNDSEELATERKKREILS